MTINSTLATGLCLFFSSFLLSQTTNNLQLPTSINEDGSLPDPSTILDVQSASKGLRIPGMTTAQRNAIVNPATGLVIYNLTDSCFNYFNGTDWYKDCGRSTTADTETASPSQGGGSSSEYAESIDADPWNNLVITGRFMGTSYFGSYTLTSAGGWDAYVVKYDLSGNVLWAVKLGGPGFDYGSDITTDHDGNILVTGSYSGTATFGSYNLTTTGSADVFTVKLDPEGNVLWALNSSNNVTVIGLGITSDPDGFACITGRYSGSAIFGSTILTSVGSDDFFLVKYDPTGIVVWARSSTGGVSGDMGIDVAADQDGNFFATGFFNTSVTFGGITLTNSGTEDVFVVKYSGAGDAVWAAKGGGNGEDNGLGITTDPAGNVVVTGYFNGTATFGMTPLISRGGRDIFIVKYDNAGNFQWAKRAGGMNSDQGESITTDTEGNILVTGNFRDSLWLDLSYMTSFGQDDAFAIKLDGSASVIWMTHGGGTDSDGGKGITTDEMNNTYAAGEFTSNANFNGTLLSSFGGLDIFIWKLSTSGSNQLLVNNLSNSGDWRRKGANLHNGNTGKVGIGFEDPTHQLTIRSTDAQTLRLIGPLGGFGHGSRLNFGDANYVYIDEPEDDKLRLQGNYIGIRRIPTTNALEVEGEASKTVAGNWLANSDARLKKNITPVDPDLMLTQLLTLQGITYEWNDNLTGMQRPPGVFYGFTAQNIREVFPTLVKQDAQGFLQTAYGTYDAMTVEALRALNRRIESLERENADLKERMIRLEAAAN